MPIDPQILKDYVSTAESGKYTSWDEINSKFPELSGYDAQVLKDYVATASSGNYTSWDEINAKFPELFELSSSTQRATDAANEYKESLKKKDVSASASGDGSSVYQKISGGKTTISEGLAGKYEDKTPKKKEPAKKADVTKPGLDLGGIQTTEELSKHLAEQSGKTKDEYGGFSEKVFKEVSMENIGTGKSDDEVVEYLSEKFPELQFSTSSLVKDEITVSTKDGYNSISIPVGGASHEEYMKGAVDRLRNFIQSNTSDERKEAVEAAKAINEVRYGIQEDISKRVEYDLRKKAGLSLPGEGYEPEQRLAGRYKISEEEQIRENFEKQKAYLSTSIKPHLDEIKKKKQDGKLSPEDEKIALRASIGSYDDRFMEAYNDGVAVKLSDLAKESKHLSDRKSKLEKDIEQFNSLYERVGETEETAMMRSALEAEAESIDSHQALVSGQYMDLDDMYNSLSEAAILISQVKEDEGDLSGAMLNMGAKGFSNILRLGIISKEDQENFMKWVGSSVVTDEWMSSEDRTFMEKLLPSLSESAGVMVSSALGGPASKVLSHLGFFAQAYYGLRDELDSNPQFKDLTEDEKTGLSTIYGLTIGFFERVGVTKTLQGSKFVDDLAASVIKSTLKTLPKNASKELIELEIKRNVKATAMRVAIRGAGATVTEGATEGTQALAETGIKDLFNAYKDYAYFTDEDGNRIKTFDGFGLSSNVWEDMKEQTLYGMAGGAIFSGIGQSVEGGVSRLTDKGIDNDLAKMIHSIGNDKQFRSLMTNYVKSEILAKRMTKEEAKSMLNSYDEMMGRMNKIPKDVNQVVDAFDLLTEKEKLQKEIEGKDKALTSAQQNRINQIDEQLKTISENAVQVTEQVNKSEAVSEPQVVTEEGKEEVVDISDTDSDNPSFEKGSMKTFSLKGGILEIGRVIGSKVSSILNLKVDEESRRQGKAERMLKSALDETKGELSGQATNDASVALNYKLGMRLKDGENLTLEETLEKRREKGVDGSVSMILPENKRGDNYTPFSIEPEVVTEEGKKEVSTPTANQITVSNELEFIQQADENHVKTVKAAGRVVKALEKLGVKVFLHKTTDEYNQGISNATGISKKDIDAETTKSRGEFITGKNEIHINLEIANARTVFHEAFHAIVKAKGLSPMDMKRFVDAVKKSGNLPKEVIKKLDDFSNQYEAGEVNEEFLSELIGDLAASAETMNQTQLQKLVDAINTLFEKIGLGAPFKGRANRKEVIDFLNGVATSFRRGESIADVKVPGMASKNYEDVVSKRKLQANFSHVPSGFTFEYLKNDDQFNKLKEDGYITEDKTMDDFGGLMILHAPDAAFSGDIYKNGEQIVEGKGGVYYPIKYHDQGYFWASTKNAAEKMAADLNEMRKQSPDGKIKMALVSAPIDKLMSSSLNSIGLMDILTSKSFDEKSGITENQVKRAIAYAVKTVTKLQKEGKEGLKPAQQLPPSVKATDDINEIRSKMREFFAADVSAFPMRKAFNSYLLDGIAKIVKSQKTKDQLLDFLGAGTFNPKLKSTGGRLSKANLKEGFSNLLAEPTLKEEGSGKIYAVIELEGDVKPVETADHESYPFAMKSVDPNKKVTLNILKDRVDWREHAIDPQTGEAVINNPERANNVLPPSAGVSGAVEITKSKRKKQISDNRITEAVKGMPTETMNISDVKIGITPAAKEGMLSDFFKKPNAVRGSSYKSAAKIMDDLLLGNKLQEPIIVNKYDNSVIDGHNRIVAMLGAGITEFNVVKVDPDFMTNLTREIASEPSRKKQISGEVEVKQPYDEYGDIDYEVSDKAETLAKDRGIGITSDRELAYYVSDDSGNVIGAAWNAYDNSTGEYTFDVVVGKDQEGKSIGSSLLDKVIDIPYEIEEMNPDATIKVDVVNPQMQKMLEKRGFIITDKVGIDRYIMEPGKPSRKKQISGDGKNKAMDDAKAKYELSKKRGNSEAQARKSAMADLKKNNWYVQASDIEKDAAVRELKEELGFKEGKKAPSAAKILGKPKPKKVEVREDTALKRMIKAQARAAREGAQFEKKARKAVHEFLKDRLKGFTGTIKGRRVSAVLNKALTMNLSKPEMQARFLEYVDKVINDANRVTAINNAVKLQKTLKNLAKNKDTQVSTKNLIKEYNALDPVLVENIDEFIAKGELLKELASKSTARFKKKDGETAADINLRQRPEMDPIKDYISKETDRAEKIRKNTLMEAYPELVEAGVIDDSMSYLDMKAKIKELETDETAITQEIREALIDEVKEEFKAVQGNFRAIAALGINPVTGEKLTKAQLKAVQDMANISFGDIESLKDALIIRDMMLNFQENGVTDMMAAKARRLIGKAEAKGMAETIDRTPGMKDGISNKVKQTERWYQKTFGQIDNLINDVFGSKKLTLLFKRVTGYSEIENGSSQAELLKSKAMKAYDKLFRKKKANGVNFYNATNEIERVIYARLMRNSGGTIEQISKEFQKNLELEIDNLNYLMREGRHKDAGEILPSEQREADAVKEVFDRLGIPTDISKAGEVNMLDIEARVDKVNKQAVQFIIDKWAEHADEIGDVMQLIYNRKLSRDNNYSHTSWRRKNPMDVDIDSMSTGAMQALDDGPMDNAPSGALMEANKPSRITDTRRLGYSFESSQFNALEAAMFDVYTASAVAQFNGFMESKHSRSGKIASRDDMDLMNKAVKSFYIKAKGTASGATDVDLTGTVLGKWIRGAAKYATSLVLGGPFAVIKQTVPAMMTTMWTSGVNATTRSVTTYWGNKSKIDSLIDESGVDVSIRGVKSIADVYTGGDTKRDKTFFRKVLGIPNKLADFWIDKFLVWSDKGVAKTTFMAYYMQSIKRQGGEFSLDKPLKSNMEAFEYAKMMTNLYQNASNDKVMGDVFSTRNQSVSFIRQTLFPYASFLQNFKTRTYTDVKIVAKNLGYKWKDLKDSEAKQAMNGIIGSLQEVGTYAAVRAMLGYSMWYLTKQMTGWDEEEEDPEILRELNRRKDRYLAKTKKPLPDKDKMLSVKEANEIAKELGVDKVYDMPTKFSTVHNDLVGDIAWNIMYEREKKGLITSLLQDVFSPMPATDDVVKGAINEYILLPAQKAMLDKDFDKAVEEENEIRRTTGKENMNPEQLKKFKEDYERDNYFSLYQGGGQNNQFGILSIAPRAVMDLAASYKAGANGEVVDDAGTVIGYLVGEDLEYAKMYHNINGIRTLLLGAPDIARGITSSGRKINKKSMLTPSEKTTYDIAVELTKKIGLDPVSEDEIKKIRSNEYKDVEELLAYRGEDKIDRNVRRKVQVVNEMSELSGLNTLQVLSKITKAEFDEFNTGAIKAKFDEEIKKTITDRAKFEAAQARLNATWEKAIAAAMR